MTDDERRTGMRVLKSIKTGIQEVESRTNIKILASSCIASDKFSDRVCFTGYNEINYEIPYHIFMTIPQKRLIIEICRALSINYNDYGQE